MNDFSFGPFFFEPGSAIRLSGELCRHWEMRYGSDFIASQVMPEASAQADIVEAFSGDRTAFIGDLLPHEHVEVRERIEVALVRSTDSTGVHGERLASFTTSTPIPGMTAGMIDDRFETWAVDGHGGSVPMGRDEFDRLADAHAALNEALDQCEQLSKEEKPPYAWITGLLPGGILIDDMDEWRAPSSWEIRHVVGEGSFTGVTGAAAARLVGVTPQNFRKYTARDGAKTRQNMSFAMWHLLLHKLGVQPA